MLQTLTIKEFGLQLLKASAFVFVVTMIIAVPLSILVTPASLSKIFIVTLTISSSFSILTLFIHSSSTLLFSIISRDCERQSA